jgi:perosamine synthetase
MSFEPGAAAPTGFIPLCVPRLDGNEGAYVKECLDTNWVSSAGPFVDRLEAEMARLVGARFAVATVNGTAALHMALKVAGIGPDDEVLVSDLTFIAPANTIRYVGAWPVFIDAEPRYWQMDPAGVTDFLEHGCRWAEGVLRNKGTGRRVRGLLPVHVLGHPVDMDPIVEAARKFDLVVIEDATESLGAKYKGRMTGGLGHLACFSFNGNKIITTGGGGMIVTDNEAWARRARYLTTQAKDDPVEYIHREIGYNYRLSNLSAAVGCAQLERLNDHIAAKRRVAAAYQAGLRGIPGLTSMEESQDAFSIFWMYTMLVEPSLFGMDSRRLLQVLAERKIQARPLWQPMHQSPAFSGYSSRPCPVSERLNRQGISLPCSVGLAAEQQQRVIAAVRDASQHA